MLNVEQAMAEVANVYQSLTGRPIQPGRADLPPEVDPMAHVESRYRQFKSLLDGQRRQTPATIAAACFSPATDVLELDREVRVYIDIPGVAREQLNVSVLGDVIIVRGERSERKPEVGAMRHKERWFGTFQKNIALPPRARREGIEAILREGILTLSIPTDGTGTEMTEMPVDVKCA